MRIERTDDAGFDRAVRDVRGELVVVYFYGDDCPACEVFHRHLPEVVAALGDAPVRLVEANARACPDAALGHAVYGVPAFHLYRDGLRLGRMSGFRGTRFFVDVLREHLPPP